MDRFWLKSFLPSMATASFIGLGASVTWFLALIAMHLLLDHLVPSSSLPDLSPGTIVSGILLSPILLAITLLLWGPKWFPGSTAHFYFASAVSEFFWPMVLVCLLATVLAVLCYRHHRRCSDRGATAWAIYVLLTGAPGAVGYWLHHVWPATESCDRCSEASPRDRETCLTCGATFPSPAPKGIEIFRDAVM